MQEITWTNCADKMPPDDDSYLIIKLVGGIDLTQVIRGSQMPKLGNWNWTPYTPEKWKELNK